MSVKLSACIVAYNNYEDIKAKFGGEIASNILKITENRNIADWYERKVNFINKLNIAEEKINEL